MGVDIVGQYAWTSSELGNRIAGLDRAIQLLAVTVATTPENDRGFGPQWKDAFQSFLRRWQVERDAASTWDARYFSLPKVNEFQRSYEFWSQDFRRKTGVTVQLPSPPSSGNEAWWWALVGAAAVLGVVYLVRR